MDIRIENNYEGLTVREVLQRHLRYSSNMIKKLKFSDGGILVNGSFVTVRYELKAGDILSLAVEDKSEDVSPYTIPVDLPLDILYEDEHITVINKPANMPSHPSLGHRDDTVSNALAFRYIDKDYVFRPVNRLDRDTSGCMLTANSKAASYRMYLSMTGGEIRKSYIAVTDGCPADREGVMHSYLRRRPDSIVMRQETDESDPEGQESITEYRVLYTDGEHSVILLSPITGRTHQIRVQLAGIGCPVTGDDMYGSASPHISRQALHSYITTFPHPASGEMMSVKAPLFSDMRELIRQLFEDGETALRIVDEI